MTPPPNVLIGFTTFHKSTTSPGGVIVQGHAVMFPWFMLHDLLLCLDSVSAVLNIVCVTRHHVRVEPWHDSVPVPTLVTAAEIVDIIAVALVIQSPGHKY